jgi:hypothetical protein
MLGIGPGTLEFREMLEKHVRNYCIQEGEEAQLN